jgi:hypothetical protein
VAVQLSALDDVTPAKLLAAPVRYYNGRDGSWRTEPAEARHLRSGGCGPENGLPVRSALR